MISSVWPFVALTLALVFFVDARNRKRDKGFYPPGPKPQFLVGNLFDIPPSKPWKKYHEWGKVYGAMIHFKVLGQHTIVLNTQELAERMLEKRSRVYSDRPSVPMLDLTGWAKLNTGLLRYGQDWRVHRRIYQQGFRENIIQRYRPIVTSKVGQLLSNLRRSPHLFEEHLRTFAADTILGTVYGYDVTSPNDRLVHIAEEAIKASAYAISPMGMVVNIFPFLGQIPLQYPMFKFQHVIRDTREQLNEMRTAPYEFVKKNMVTGKGKPALLAELLVNHASNGGDEYQEEIIKDATATAYAAGVETTAIVLLNFCLAMAIHPDIQKRAQLEIETVVGKEQLPTYEDRSGLPYIEAILRETLRWSPPFPLGIPHAAYIDDTIDGYYISKGIAVIGNIWAMTRDESVYRDPESFVPERFLNDAGTLNDDEMLLPFGFGRRMCAGRHFVIPTLWTAMSSILSQFHISRPEDTTGKPIRKLADLNFYGGFTTGPENFRCRIESRLE